MFISTFDCSIVTTDFSIALEFITVDVEGLALGSRNGGSLLEPLYQPS